jgi:prepilin-type N-terminal cleavage/methylation domain-containing protein
MAETGRVAQPYTWYHRHCCQFDRSSEEAAMTTRARRTGFTLIELLVVVGILAVLAALLFPVLSKARGQARSITCVSNLRQVGLALQMYQSDWGRMPNDSFRDTFGDPRRAGEDLLHPYTRSGAVYHCPEARSGLAGNYLYRGAFSLTYREPGVPFVNDARTIRLSPTSVLAYCQEHTRPVSRPTWYEGSFVVLRADISVKRIPAAQAAIWGWAHQGNRWIPPPLLDPPLNTTLYPVFPEEPWPPEFED